jgi:hypothetical protein
VTSFSTVRVLKSQSCPLNLIESSYLCSLMILCCVEREKFMLKRKVCCPAIGREPLSSSQQPHAQNRYRGGIFKLIFFLPHEWNKRIFSGPCIHLMLIINRQRFISFDSSVVCSRFISISCDALKQEGRAESRDKESFEDHC